ncbi:hypothetical protein P3T76_001891 [Phytophthora citrophthora]|uniref:Uncharacterized protein n=1 Tax=Phytophthora citrophthora TaxID=4793 RepID=A0AAD9GYD5_9STRA|nr:hypothetical protein P3T76_001891 [Phytophthora citrophthora]
MKSRDNGETAEQTATTILGLQEEPSGGDLRRSVGHCDEVGSTLPFALNVAADAYWRFFGCGYGMQSRHEADVSTSTIARAFKIRTDSEGFTSKVTGKYSARRYVDSDGSIVIVWTGSGDVEEIGDVTFNGVQVHKRGWIKLRRVPRQGANQQSTSTVVEASFETIPMLHDSIENKKQEAQKFLDVVAKSYHILDKLFCNRMGSLLVEEDWKATFNTTS